MLIRHFLFKVCETIKKQSFLNSTDDSSLENNKRATENDKQFQIALPLNYVYITLLKSVSEIQKLNFL